MKIYCRVTSDGLIPLYDSDLDEKKRLKIGTDVEVEVKKARNIKFHKKFFALLRLVLDNMPDGLKKYYEIYNEESFLFQIKEDLKLFKEYKGGRKEYLSISFEAMDEYTFSRFYNIVVKLMLTKYIQLENDNDIEEELYKFM